MLTHWEGEPVDVLRGLWEVPRLEIHATLPSTNDRADELRSAGAPAFTVVVAEKQTAGRGRAGRHWVSGAGDGVWLSLLVPAASSEAGGTVMPLLAGLAVARAVEETVPEADPRVKWPNDVLVAGRKVAGILCERSVAREPAPLAVVGVGVNVRPPTADAPEEVRDRAAALEEAGGGGRVSRVGFTGRLLRACRDLLGASPTHLEARVRAELEARDALRGYRVKAEGGACGVAKGLDEEGALLLEEDDGTPHRVRAGRLLSVTATKRV